MLLLCSTSLFAQNPNYADHRHRERKVDSLEHILATSPPTGNDLIVIYSNLASGYTEISAKKTREYARKGIALAEKAVYFGTLADLYMLTGLSFYGESCYDSAMVYYQKALDATEKMKTGKNSSGQPYTKLRIDNNFSKTYGNMGNLFNIQGKWHEAVEYYQKALKIFEEYGWKESQAIAYENIGEMYLAMDNFEQSEVNFTKLYAIGQEIKDSLIIMYANKELSALYLVQKDYDKALEHAEATHSYIFSHPEEGEGAKAFVFNLFARIYLEGYNDMEKAENYIRQALQIGDSTEIEPREKAVSLTLLSSIHLKRGEWRKAEQTALETLVTDDTEPGNTLSLYENLAKAYSHLGNAVKANEYFDKHDELQSSWSSKHYQSAIREMETKYETEKKETKIATLEDEKRLMIWLSVAGGAVLLLALAAFFFLWRWTVQKKRLAESQKELAEQQIKQLEQEKQLIATQAILDGEVQERTRLARDLHDGLGSMLTGARMSIESLKNDALRGKTDIANFDNALKILNDSSHELRRIAHHLMPDTLSRFGLKISVGDFCDSLSAVKFLWYGDDTRLNPKMEEMIYRTVHELVNNALKHARASQVLVQIIQEQGRLAFTVQDDGCGFDPKTVTEGMGLQNIRTRVASFGGMMNIASKAGEGTEINVELKIEN